MGKRLELALHKRGYQVPRNKFKNKHRHSISLVTGEMQI